MPEERKNGLRSEKGEKNEERGKEAHVWPEAVGLAHWSASRAPDIGRGREEKGGGVAVALVVEMVVEKERSGGGAWWL